MPREFATVPLALWDDDAWLNLTPAAQHLYLVLSTTPGLTHAGVADWRPARLAARAAGWTSEDVVSAGKELQGAGQVVIDESTEEVLLVRFLADDGLMKQPNMAVAMLRAHSAIASRTLRGVVVWVLQRLREASPDLAGWGGKGVLELLDRPSIDPSAKGSDDPSPDPPDNPSRGAGGTLPETLPGTLPERGATLLAPSSCTSHPSPSGSLAAVSQPTGTTSVDASQQAAPPDDEPASPKTKRGTRLPADWQPTRELVEQMRGECPGVDLKAEHLKFVDHWLSKSGSNATKLDWPRTWCNWMRTARDRMPRRDEPARGQTMWDREAGR
jgi:hypothetical protein